MRQIILDTETTGLEWAKGHRIIEIGCVEMINRQLTKNSYHRYINPERLVDAGAFNVHGISNEFLQDKPTFKEIFQEFLDYVDGAELIIHNAAFDLGFINAEFKHVKYVEKTIQDHCSVIDTLLLARQLHPGQKNNLDALCKRYSIDNSHRQNHGALLDAEILSLVYLAMTGGQTSLFMSADNAAQTASQTQRRKKATPNVELPVVAPNEEEQSAHDEYLAMLKKKGQCEWA